MAHLRELRNRLFSAAAGIVVGAVAGWILYPVLFDALQAPVLDLAESRGQTTTLNFWGVATSFDMQIKVAFFAGVILSSPWWIYQLWAFVTPGLNRAERRYTLGFLGAGVPLFLSGAALAWWLLPKAVAVLTGFTPTGAVNIIEASTYLTFIMRMVLAFGIAFLLPVLMVGLSMAGLVTAKTWLAGWRWAVLGCFFFGAAATPTGDAVSMLALAVPMTMLYFGAVGISAIADRRHARRTAAALA